MSGDDHGHGSGHGHDSHDQLDDIIPVGSLPDKILALVCLAALWVLFSWGQGFGEIAAKHHLDKPSEAHGESSEHS